jgi:hypothetical protein
MNPGQEAYYGDLNGYGLSGGAKQAYGLDLDLRHGPQWFNFGIFSHLRDQHAKNFVELCAFGRYKKGANDCAG